MTRMTEVQFHQYLEGWNAYQFDLARLNAYRSALWRQGWLDAVQAARQIDWEDASSHYKAVAK